MSKIAQQNNAAEKDPRVLLSHVMREITGVYTNGSRIGIPDDKVYNLENIIPIGPQNAHVVNNMSGILFDFLSDTIYWAQSVNLNNTEYLICFANNGKVHVFNVNANTDVLLTGQVLSGSNSRCVQWKNSQVLIIDSTGYYNYDGTNFSKITGAGVPTSGDDIAVFAGRVWIVQGRTIFTSGADDFTAASWLPSNGASFSNITDPQIRSKIQRMTVSNGLLYLYASTSINIISNVIVPIGAVPPTPVYQNTNIQTLVGTDQPASLFAVDRFSMFANRYGVYQLYGLSAPKISNDINGTWQYLDFTKPISGGQVVIEGILCSAFLINRLNDPVFGTGTVMAMVFQTGEDQFRWWFANFGNLSFIVSAFLNNQATLFCFKNNQLFKLFADPTSAPTAQVMTKLWAMEDDLARKEIIKVGFIALFFLSGSFLQLTIDTPTRSIDSGIQTNILEGSWINASGIIGQWQNAVGTVGGWFGPGPYLAGGQAFPMFERFVGLTLNTTGWKFELDLMAMDYKLGDRWL